MNGEEYILKAYTPTQFENAISTVQLNDCEPMLPLIHCADFERRPGSNVMTATEIFTAGEIRPVMCDVFHEDLVYTYVGRPAYREFHSPACFILKPLPKLLQNLFLFDTGAYREERYSQLVDSFQDIHLFRIPATADDVRRFIRMYFHGNENYFFSRSAGDEGIQPEESLEEFSYDIFRRLSSFLRLNFDDRCRTLENIIRTPVRLDEALQGIIFPASKVQPAEYPAWNESFYGTLDLMSYDNKGGDASSSECLDALDQMLVQYYRKKGYFTVHEAED